MAIVTGGASGIGKAVAQRLSDEGVVVVIAGRSQERGATASAELGKGVAFVQTDVSQETDVQHLVRYTLEHYGRIDYLFNNAGIEAGMGAFEDTTAQLVDEVLGINVKGVFLAIKHVAPVMVRQQGGVIINTASFVGTTMPIPMAAIYGATKAAVLSLTRAAALGYADQHIRVYAVCPWMTDTPMADRQTDGDAVLKDQYAQSINPSGKMATVEDLAGATVGLMTGQIALASGEAVLVDHGGTLSRIVPMSVA